MDEIKKLFQVKRIFAMILAAAMVITMMPTTANAASVGADTQGQQVQTDLPQADGTAQTTYSLDDRRETDEESETVYNEDNAADGYYQSFEDALYNIYVITATEGEEPTEECLPYSGLQTEWQVKTGEGEAAKFEKLPDGNKPVQAGEYQLSVTFPDGKTGAVPFVVRPAGTWAVVELNPLVAGNKVSEVTAQSLIQSLYFEGEGMETVDFTTDLGNIDPDIDGPYPALVAGSIQIKYADTGKAVPGTEVLSSNKDYAVDITFGYADKTGKVTQSNYKLPGKMTLGLWFGDLIRPEVAVSLLPVTVDGVETPVYSLTRTYTGEAVAAPAKTTEYTVKVQYTQRDENGNAVEDENGNPVIKEIADAALTEGWYSESNIDENDNLNLYGIQNQKIDAPKDAGIYYYGLFYEGEEGIYERGYTEIVVEVEPASVKIVPKSFGADQKFYAGMTARQVLAAVEYEVQNAAGTAVADAYLGYGVDFYNCTQKFEPLFKLQKEIKTETVPDPDAGTSAEPTVEYLDVDDDDTLEAGEKYRIIFTGNKTIYASNGDIVSLYWGINDPENGFNQNYHFDTDEEVLEKNVVTFTADTGISATIDISAILKDKDNKGDSYENPVTVVYGEDEPFYKLRAEYKKAVVTAGSETLAQNTDKQLTYTWQIQNGFNEKEVTDPTTGQTTIVKTPKYEPWQMPYRVCPTDAGNYRLVISYQDKANVYHAENKEVYYKIEPQKIKVVPSSAPNAFYYGEEGTDGESVYYDYISGLGTDSVEYKIMTVPTKGEAEELAWDVDDYEIHWTVEKQTDAAKDTWTDAFGEVFKKGTVYRLAVQELELQRGGSHSLNPDNYVNYEVVTTGTGETATESNKYLNETTPITLQKMGDIELKLVWEPEKAAAVLNKTYDGEELDIRKYFKVNDAANGFLQIVNAADNADVSKDILDDAGFVISWYDETEDEIVEKPVNGGSYSLIIYFRGSDKYQGIYDEGTLTANIIPKTVTVDLTKALHDTVIAGTHIWDAYDPAKVEFAGYVEKDKEAFTYGLYRDKENSYYTYGWQAVRDIGLAAYGEDGSEVDYTGGRFKGGMKYTLKTKAIAARAPYEKNYEFVNKELGWPLTVQYGSSSVVGTRALPDDNKDARLKAVKVYDKIESKDGQYTHTVTPMEGIPYLTDVWNGSAGTNKLGEDQNGNFIAIKIKLPEEYVPEENAEERYPELPIFENNIRAAGGFVDYESMPEEEGKMSDIVAVFNVTDKGKKEFDIQWAEGYKEHFVLDCTNAALLEDLSKAVAPKSIAFNNPVKKMAVGGEQQLDVKLTKMQESDTIYLTYVSDNEAVICVDEQGYVTALAAGKATVTVYASRRDANGNAEKLQPEKKASVQITVSEVTAPKIKKVTATDRMATVSFPTVNDGWRTECYVLKGSQTESAFKTAIGKFEKTGNWQESGLAAEPVLFGIYNPVVKGKTDYKTMCADVYGLEANTEYTVYARNVSQIRTLEDGCKVTESAQGSVKTFETTLPQALELAFDFEYEASKFNWDDEVDMYVVELKGKTAEVKVTGGFEAAADPTTGADPDETLWLNLPLTRDQQKLYVNPKLTYSVGVVSKRYLGEKDLLQSFEGGYLYKSSLASIDKKGKLKLSNPGVVTVFVTDTNTGCWASEEILIKATPDSVAGRTVKLQVGQSIGLNELLIYKESGKALNGLFNYAVRADENILKAVEAQKEYFKLENGRVIAVKAGGSLNLPIKDDFVGGDPVTAKITSTVLDPVKNLKASVLTDQYFDIEFTHSGYAEAFRIVVTDARGSLLRSAYVPKDYIYNAETGKYVYRMLGLTKKSKYNVAVIALYGDQESKEVKKSLTTTLLPASYVSLKADEYGGKKGYNGVKINVVLDGYSQEINEVLKVSGNTYTLALGGDKLNDGAKYAVTDTLTWSSSNTKAATVKANPGTYTATLKAVGAGLTTIEVKSKITKAVIARYKIYINAVGDAYSYYGDNEALERQEFEDVTYDDSDAIILAQGRGKRISVQADGYKVLKFTAQSAGVYEFYSADSTDDTEGWLFHSYVPSGMDLYWLDHNCVSHNDDTYGRDFSIEVNLKQNQTVSLVAGAFSLESEIDTTIYVNKIY